MTACLAAAVVAGQSLCPSATRQPLAASVQAATLRDRPRPTAAGLPETQQHGTAYLRLTHQQSQQIDLRRTKLFIFWIPWWILDFSKKVCVCCVCADVSEVSR